MRRLFCLSISIICLSLIIEGCGGGGGKFGKSPYIETIPQAVSLQSPTEAATSSLYLSWTQNIDSDFDSYKIYISKYSDVTQSSALFDTIKKNTTVSKRISGLSISTKYYFKVFVCDTAGQCSGSNEVNGRTLFICDVTAGEINKVCDPATLPDKVDNLLETRFPPELQSVTLAPAESTTGKYTAITANIYNPSVLTTDTTTEVSLYYSTNLGKSWSSAVLSSEDSKLWTGKLPALNKGSSILYSIRATDSSSNTFTSISCKIDKKTELSEASLINSDCVHNILSSCESSVPRGCLFKAAGDDPPADDSGEIMPAWSDIVDYRIGYDSDNMYFDLAVDGEIDGGTLSPTDVHIYGSAIINKDNAGSNADLDTIINLGGVMVYAPPLKMFESTGFISDCFFSYHDSDSDEVDMTGIKCLAKQNHILFSVSWTTLNKIGVYKNNIIQSTVFTGGMTDMSDFSNLKGYILDNSHVTNIILSENNIYQIP